ncbi:type VII secretion protein EccB [Rhodococcus oxybenzonivorans]|uniref:Type VII secretion protein EccB n=1 Tax=Rhodococcus oxybenzonivorans TaxID=1990687 RepID=A0A2S2BXX0_9NOCA|nr:type VII secretion protein EccB [Rhodococcus oxybenzonivorans]AWK73496.1 type VII secretion protein EccB [Rhodococcus oxybenzonivorans]
MAVTPTTRWQVNGYRFLVRRMEHALVRRDVRMLHDPMRSQSRALAVGVVIASLGLAGCAALALFRPQDKIGDASIVVGKDSGAMFVVMGDTLRPVLNLSSARLIVGQAEKPVIVKESEIDTRPRGALVGIPGAPSALPPGDAAAKTPWAVCDSVGADGHRAVTTSVVVGEPDPIEGGGGLARDQALLVSTSDAAYLMYNGTRAKIDLHDPAITRALGLEGATPRPVSLGFVNAVPEVPPLVAPSIPGAGSQPRFALRDKVIGSVFQVVIGSETTHYVVLRDGIQKISSAVANLIFLSDSHGDTEMSSVSPDATNRIPSVEQIAVSSFPESAPEIVDAISSPVSCLIWKPLRGQDETAASGPAAELSLIAGRSLPIPDGAHTVKLAQADGGGDSADFVYVEPGSGGFVQATGIEPHSTRRDSTFFVADTGVRFGVPDADAAKALGVTAEPPLAPWQILGLLAPGPTLAKSSALVAHDGVAPDPDPAAVASGSN